MDTVIRLNNVEGFSLGSLARKCGRVLSEPTRFFRYDLPPFTVPEALTFGLGNAWVAAVLAFFVQTFDAVLISRLLERWMQNLLASEEGLRVLGLSPTSFLFTAGSLLLAPFLLLARTFLFAFFLFLFSRLLIEDRPSAPEPVTFAGALRIEGIALTARWFRLVPIFGGLLSFLVGLVLAVTGVRERFGVSNRRAVGVVLAPYLILVVAALALAAVLAVALTQVSLQDLLDVDASSLGG